MDKIQEFLINNNFTLEEGRMRTYDRPGGVPAFQYDLPTYTRGNITIKYEENFDKVFQLYENGELVYEKRPKPEQRLVEGMLVYDFNTPNIKFSDVYDVLKNLREDKINSILDENKKRD